MQVTSAAIPKNQQDPVVLEGATTKLPKDTKVKPMAAPAKNMVVDAISLNKTTMGMANMSYVDHTADGNPSTDDTK